MPVSLSEILNIQANPELGTGTPAVVLDNSKLINMLNQNAQYQAENTWRKYTTFLNNFKEVAKDVGEISKMDVATQDRDALQKEAGDIFSTIAKDPRGFFSGGTSMRDVYQKLSGLQSRASESKLNKTFDDAHRAFIARNPELNTPENQQKIQSYLAQPLGNRQAYTLDMPTLFDAGAYTKGLMESPIVKRKTAESTLVNEKKEPGTEYIRELEKVKYDRNAFMNAWMNGLNTQDDKYGHTIRGAIEQRFKKLPSELKKQIGSVENYFRIMGESAFGSDKDIEDILKDELKTNPNAYKDQQLALDRERVKQGWARIGIDRERLNKEDDEDIMGANSVTNEAFSIIEDALQHPREIENYEGRGKKKTVYELSDPNLLQKFGNIDKNGTVTNIPDEVQWDKDADKLNLIYFKKKPSLVPGMGGEPVLTSSGKRQIQDSKSLSARTWLKEITKRSFPNKNIGTINTLVDEFYTKGGNNLFKLNEKVKAAQQPIQQQQSIPAQKYKAKMGDGSIITSPDGKTWYDKNGKQIQ